MGLLAIVVGRARGLFPLLICALPYISFLCFSGGLLWLIFLPQDGQFRNTYFSENALLPHQAITFFRETEWDVVRGLKGQLHEFQELGTSEIERNAEIAALFEQFGLTAATHDWTVGDKSGQNVYAMQHASRGPHNEAIVIAAPWIGQHGAFNEGGVALLLALSRFFERWNFWHKNLIFVLPSNSDVALRQWVEAYHTNLQYTAGSIEGAIVLNYESDAEYFDHVEVCFEGLNGELPNLDLVNTAVYSVAAEFASCSVLGETSSDNYMERLKILSKHIWQQASAGVVSGCASSMFSGWRITAVTLNAVPGSSNYDITTLGRVCESTARSINNLLEHFHQSFFFYLMLGNTKFVSIASYLPAAMLVTNSFSVMALYRLANMPSEINASDWGSAILTVATVSIGSGLLGHYIKSLPLVGTGLAAILYGVYVLASYWSSTVRCQLLHMIILAVLGLELTTLAMINFSLALAIGVMCAPLAWVRPKIHTLSSAPMQNSYLLGITFPLAAFTAVAYYVVKKPLLEVLNDLISGYHDLGVSTWLLVMGIWVPAWLITAASSA